MDRENVRLLGSSPAFSDMLQQVSNVAPLDRPVLLVGERGTGKELIAARLHYLSSRWDSHYEAFNCAAISDNLIESELFGYEAGAFTGAGKRHRGRFERADGGTLFMDELATTSARVQEQMLRVIEYGQFQRVGGESTQAVDVRLIAATNEDLPALAESGRFRFDLLDRLSFDVITLPPLRARQEDIPELAEHFASGISGELGREFFAGFSERVTELLLRYPWPGNVRELKNAVERSVYRWPHSDKPLDDIIFDPFESPYRPGSHKQSTEDVQPDQSGDYPGNYPGAQQLASNEASISSALLSADIAEKLLEGSPAFDLRQKLDELEAAYILQALRKTRFRQKPAAEILGLSYHQLRASLRKYPELLER